MNLNGAGRQFLTFEAIEVNSFWQNFGFSDFRIFEKRSPLVAVLEGTAPQVRPLTAQPNNACPGNRHFRVCKATAYHLRTGLSTRLSRVVRSGRSNSALTAARSTLADLCFNFVPSLAPS
jgi:hypothetical protein